MKPSLASRTSLSPFVAVAFAVIAATGVLLFFHVKNGPIMVLHEWFGWAFVVAGCVHVVINARPLLGYLRQTSARVSLLVALLLGLAMTFAGLNHGEGPHGHRPPAQENGAPRP